VPDLDVLFIIQICQRSGDLYDSVGRAGGKCQSIHRGFEQFPGIFAQGTITRQLTGFEVAI
jgi:hypothetical protein